MDLDSTRSVGSHQEILSAFAQRQYDILLGTQMVAKGHDFPHVTLVGILAADFEWSLPDFRAVERGYRLIVQAAGRTGRRSHGEVVIQTWTPKHPVLKWIAANDYQSMYDNQIRSRQPLSYPPFGRLIVIRLTSGSQSEVEQTAKVLKDQLSQVLQYSTLIGPGAPPIERVENRYRRSLMIKIPSRFGHELQAEKNHIREVVMKIGKEMQKSGLRIAIDVDPTEI
jgi:primosomal protein N' (replication factor Y)